jgi:hypothetical protein
MITAMCNSVPTVATVFNVGIVRAQDNRFGCHAQVIHNESGRLRIRNRSKKSGSNNMATARDEEDVL